ncbi:hypothetical protein Acife_1169 [Acidithiobacillus ferrivorans SS3]|uniref:Uncharacterized protein n=1 Tax=Acidithiobacillus ferrivorans SS3 TaxID=743299 RepID=G0JP97_9PROT|nr:hypothetical protein [Acidithiobacillus ferrivorans]AEM47328.1 hypothetical protein Acife_1169 [Acidithiobacillus ferrivorans SS3]
MNIGAWNYLSIFALIMSMSWFFYESVRLVKKLEYALLIFSIGWFLSTPQAVSPDSILGSYDDLSIWLNFFWHIKMYGLSFNDVISVLVFLISFFVVKGKITKGAGLLLLLMVFVWGIGTFSLLLSPRGIYIDNYLNPARVFILILSGYFTGLKFTSYAHLRVIKSYFILLIKLLLIWFVVFLLLSNSYKAIRYGMPALLINQSWQTVAFANIGINFILSGTRRQKSVALLVGLIPVIGFYKDAILSYLLFLLFFVKSKVGTRQFSLKFFRFLPLVMFLLTPVIIYFGSHIIINNAIVTRWFQIYNSVATLFRGGVATLLFGIGFGQWYHIYYQFPFIDYGAWGMKQIMVQNWKFSIQSPFFSLLRSVGIVGVSAWLFILALIAEKIIYFGDIRNKRAFAIFVFIYLGYQMGSFPALLPSNAMLIGFIIGFFYSANQRNLQESMCGM